MSWPQPTAQYGQTPSVTTAPRSREALAAVCGLKGWSCTRCRTDVPARSRWNTLMPPDQALEAIRPAPAVGAFRVQRFGSGQSNTVGTRVGVEMVVADKAK